MPKKYILKAPDFKDLKKPCITGVIPDIDDRIIYQTKIHIPRHYFEEKGTYQVIPTDRRLPQPVNHSLQNSASFDITRDIFSATGDRPFYLNFEDSVRIFDNDGVQDWDYFDYDAKERTRCGYPPIINKKVKELFLINAGLILVSGEPKVEIKYVEKEVLKTKPTDMREIGRKIIPVIRSSC